LHHIFKCKTFFNTSQVCCCYYKVRNWLWCLFTMWSKIFSWKNYERWCGNLYDKYH